MSAIGMESEGEDTKVDCGTYEVEQYLDLYDVDECSAMTRRAHYIGPC
jgi:hypothetical protein